MTIEPPLIDTGALALAPARPLPLWDLVEESFSEAAFLWGRFEDALASPQRDLAAVSFWVEERLLGNLDGVRVAGVAARDLLTAALAGDDPLGVTAAAHLLATDTLAAAIEVLVPALRAAAPEALPRFGRALQLVRSDVLLARLERDLAALGPELVAMLVEVRGFKRGEPGILVAEALGASHPGLLTAGLRALRHLAPDRPGRNTVVAHLDSGDVARETAAVETGLILGVPAAWTRCERGVTGARPAAHLFLPVALLGDNRAQAALYVALADPALQKSALFALGHAGTKAAANACLEAMKQEPLARLAAEAFCAITGLDLDAEHLIAPDPKPEPEEPIPFEQEDLDADLVPTAEDGLPRPDVAGVTRWWASNGARFAADKRYLRGRVLDLAGLQEGLRREPTRRRPALALELAIRSAGRYQVQTHAFTAEQRRQMEAFDRLGGAAMPRSQLARVFSPL